MLKSLTDYISPKYYDHEPKHFLELNMPTLTQVQLQKDGLGSKPEYKNSRWHDTESSQDDWLNK